MLLYRPKLLILFGYSGQITPVATHKIIHTLKVVNVGNEMQAEILSNQPIK